MNFFMETIDLGLEALELRHITDEYISWLNNPEVTKYNSHGIYPNTSDKTRKYVESISSDKSTIVLAIIEKKSKKHIGNIAIQRIDLINSNADIAILIGEQCSWGKGYATQAFEVVIKHCFDMLNLHKVTAGTTSDNIAMQKVLEKVGFSNEGMLKDAMKRNSIFVDIYLYGLIKTK